MNPGKHNNAKLVKCRLKYDISFKQWCEGFDINMSVYIDKATSVSGSQKPTWRRLLTMKAWVMTGKKPLKSSFKEKKLPPPLTLLAFFCFILLLRELEVWHLWSLAWYQDLKHWLSDFYSCRIFSSCKLLMGKMMWSVCFSGNKGLKFSWYQNLKHWLSSSLLCSLSNFTM